MSNDSKKLLSQLFIGLLLVLVILSAIVFIPSWQVQGYSNSVAETSKARLLLNQREEDVLEHEEEVTSAARILHELGNSVTLPPQPPAERRPTVTSATVASYQSRLLSAQKQLDASRMLREAAKKSLILVEAASADQALLLDTQNKLRLTVVQGIGGVLVLLTATVAGFNWWVAKENLRATQDKQASERFVKATENLGSTILAVRLGAIYSMEGLARDSKADHSAILRMLALFTRINTRTSSAPEATGETALPILESLGLRDDIQTALTVLTIRIKRASGIELDLSEANFSGAVLSEANLERANLNSTILSAAELRRANLAHSNLSSADFVSANLSEARLEWANLQDALLTNAELSRATLSFASLKDADLVAANLSEANMAGANLDGADLTDTDLTGAIGLTVDQLSKALGNNNTRLPAGMPIPDHFGGSANIPETEAKPQNSPEGMEEPVNLQNAEAD